MIAQMSLWGGKPLADGYTLVRLIGRGGFGEVWEAEADGRRSALKFLRCADDFGAPRELRATIMVKELSHPRLMGLGEVRSFPGYLVVQMELAEASLADRLADALNAGRLLPARDVCGWLAQAAEGLDFLNARQHRVGGRPVGVQHADVKPSNMLLVGGEVKLCDFGLATALAGPLMTQYARSGTPAYAAPEVFAGRLSDRSDQYALAVSYCELRTGRAPFPDPPRGFSRSYVRAAPDLRGLTPGEARVVARALAREPRDRWPTCGALVARLDEEVSTVGR